MFGAIEARQELSSDKRCDLLCIATINPRPKVTLFWRIHTKTPITAVRDSLREKPGKSDVY